MLEQITSKWNQILETYRDKKEMTDVSYRTWLKPLKPLALEKGILTLYYPGDNARISFIEKRYGTDLEYIIEDITGLSCKLAFSASLIVDKTPRRNEIVKETPVYQTNLNPRYTFESFVVGNNNKFAHAAALAVAESPAEVYNPLFIYGGSGLGKTHLIQSIAHFILRENPSCKVLYITAEKFMNELIYAISQQTTARKATEEFREKYRNNDVLIIDDVQFIASKRGTQEEIFHTFNALYENKKQIIFTCDRPPKEIDNLEERIRSRFLSGLTVDISLPDYETRMAILRKKEEIEGYHIDNEIINYIATNIKSNIRELEGALTKIVAISKLSNKPLTLESAKIALQDTITPQQEQEISLPYIVGVVCEHFGITQDDFFSERRVQNVVIPRQVFMYLTKEAHFSGTVVARYLNMDHSTVIYSVRKVEDLMKNDKNILSTVDVLRKKIRIS